MRRRIGPFDAFKTEPKVVTRLGKLDRSGRGAEARCLASAIIEIRDRGADDALVGHRPGLYDVHRCGHILQISVARRGRVGALLALYSP